MTFLKGFLKIGPPSLTRSGIGAGSSKVGLGEKCEKMSLDGLEPSTPSLKVRCSTD